MGICNTPRTGFLCACLALHACSAGTDRRDDQVEIRNGSNVVVARDTDPAEPPQAAQRSGDKQTAPAASAGKGLCDSSEEIIFQCGLGTKRVAICAGNPASDRSYVQYRYGSPGAVELTYPKEPSAGPGSLTWASAGYSGGGEAQIRFVHEGHEYVVYSRIVRTGFGPEGHNEPQEEAGYFVRKGGKVVSQRKCDTVAGDPMGAPAVDLARAQALLPEGEIVYPED